LASTFNYPPDEILDPTMGRPNYEYIILWILSNNDLSTWSDLKEKVNRSTLSIYLNRLKRDGFIVKSGFNQYRITSAGKTRFYELGMAKRGRKLSYPPHAILNRRNYDHWILWVVYNNNYCKWADFLEDPIKINQSSLSKNLNDLIDKKLVRKEEKKYKITQSGKLEYSKMLRFYDLDRQSILEEESKRIAELTQKTLKFFEIYDISIRDIQFRFLYNVLQLDYSQIKNVLRSEEDFHKIILFLSINHPNEYPDYISTDTFSEKYEIKKTTLDYYIDKIVENQIFPIKFFKLEVLPDKFYYFQSDEKVEMLLRVITEEHITKFTYLNKLFENSSKITLPLDMESTVKAILDEACQHIFKEGLKNSLKKFLPEYINYLAFKIKKERKLVGISDKLEGIIWQNIPDLLEAGISQTSQYQFIGENDMNYYIETEILEVLRPYLASKPYSIYKKINQSLNKKEYGKVLDLIDLAIKSNKDSIDLVIYKAIVFCNLNCHSDSIKLLNDQLKVSQIDEKNPIFIPLFFVLGFSYISLGEFEKSLDIVNSKLKKFPENSLSYALNGLIFGYNTVYTFDVEKASEENGQKYIDNAIKLESFKSNKARFYQLKSQLLLDLNQHDKALEAIESAIILSPKTYDLYNSKNRILLYFDRFDEIITILDKLIDEFPEGEKNLKIKKAYILKEMKNIEAGLEIINELIEKYPEDNNLILNKIYWLQFLDQQEDVLKTMQYLIEQDPESGIYHDTFGEILMNFEEYEKAIDEFKEAIELGSSEWYINQTFVKLGICFKEIGKTDLAIENLTKGKDFTNKCYCDLDTKRKWLSIAELYLAEIVEMEAEF